MDQDDVLFGNLKWLENFKEMKQAAIDPLYEGLLMQKLICKHKGLIPNLNVKACQPI